MKNKYLAAFLNAIPGLGYLYLGVRIPFACLLLLSCLVIFTGVLLDPAYANAPTPETTGWDVVFTLLIVAAFVVDAFLEAKKINQAQLASAALGTKTAQGVHPKPAPTLPVSGARTVGKIKFGIASLILSQVAIAAGVLANLNYWLDPYNVASLGLEPGFGSIVVPVFTHLLGALVLGVACLAIDLFLLYKLNERQDIQRIGLDEWLPSRGRWVMDTFKLLGLIIAALGFYETFTDYWYVNGAVLAFDLLQQVGSSASMLAVLSIISVLTKRQDAPVNPAR